MAEQPREPKSSETKELARLYEELRGIARSQLARERKNHTLQATALVNEAWLRLAETFKAQGVDKNRFFLAAAQAMRHILVDHARSRGRQKRGGGSLPSSLDAAELVSKDGFAEILAVDEAIERLSAEDPRLGELVRLRFYAGLEMDEIAAAQGISPRTAFREWAYAKAWLARELGEPPRESAP